MSSSPLLCLIPVVRPLRGILRTFILEKGRHHIFQVSVVYMGIVLGWDKVLHDASLSAVEDRYLKLTLD